MIIVSLCKWWFTSDHYRKDFYLPEYDIYVQVTYYDTTPQILYFHCDKGHLTNDRKDIPDLIFDWEYADSLERKFPDGTDPKIRMDYMVSYSKLYRLHTNRKDKIQKILNR